MSAAKSRRKRQRYIFRRCPACDLQHRVVPMSRSCDHSRHCGRWRRARRMRAPANRQWREKGRRRRSSSWTLRASVRSPALILNQANPVPRLPQAAAEIRRTTDRAYNERRSPHVPRENCGAYSRNELPAARSSCDVSVGSSCPRPNKDRRLHGIRPKRDVSHQARHSRAAYG